MKKSTSSPTLIFLVTLVRCGLNPQRTIAGLAMFLSAQVASGQMIGHEMQLDIRGPESDNAPNIISYADFDPVTVGPEVEYHVGPEDSPFLARHSIDITDDSLLFDYSQCDCSGRFFRHDEFNGFIVSDASGTLRPILNATVDQAETSNIRLTDDRISVSNDDVTVNVAGLSASSRSKFKIDLQFAHFGDANLDGQVDFADFLTLSGNFGQAGRWEQGDFNGDDVVGFGDFLLLSKDFGNAVNPTTASVPEPNAITLATFCAAGLLGLRRRARCACIATNATRLC